MSYLKNISPKVKIGIPVFIFIIILFLVFKPSAGINKRTATVEIQPFSMEVSATGEVQALKYETINVPELMHRRELRVYYLKITDLVAEGTNVKKGDFIATLDPADVEDRLKKSYERIDEHSNSLESAILDSTIALSQNRDQIVNFLDNLEESKIKVEQSKYESKAVQRQAQISLEKAVLDLNAKKRNYEKEIQKQKTKIARIQKRLDGETKTRDMLEELKKQLHIKSPSNGMVVYGRSWRGTKIKVSDDVGPWMPIIATIPDLSSLVSEAIVKEIDIAKIKLNQVVKLTIDAFPDDVFEGKVIRIANIGQPIKDAGMNGFKVLIEIDTKNKKILPGMTTTNQIVTAHFENDMVVPREAVFGNDTNQYVFIRKTGSTEKQQVKTDGENETHIRIIDGINIGDQVLLSRPDKFKDPTN
ncbi:HlyD family efflux transporter periplasmic adaptor subunit [Labilibacter sediminis]|nr:HlyD family efflux transporter periplasmic adaptor subunit [Labilibacter sediminis]